VTSSVAVFEAVMRVTSKISVIEHLKKRGNMENKMNFYVNLHLEYGLRVEITASCYGELMPKEALTSFTVCDDAYRYLRVRHNVTKLVTRRIFNTKG